MVYKKNFALLVFTLTFSLSTFCANGRSHDNKNTILTDKNDHPVYRRIDLNNQLRSVDLGSILPAVLEFHVLNDATSGFRLYENSGDYRNPDNQSDRFGSCGGRIYNKDERTGDYKRDSLGNVLSFLGINMSSQYGKATNYGIYLDTAYINRGTGWIKPQYMFVVDPYTPEECEVCNPETGESETHNGKYIIGRYLYNTAMYAKAVADSMQLTPGNWVFADKYYDAEKGEGIPVSENATESGYYYRSNNFNKVQPIDNRIIRIPDSKVYTHDDSWERLAFAWAIHKGDSLYILKGTALEPMYKGAMDDPYQLWLTLTKEYGEEGKYIDFAKLISENIVPGSAYKEAYYPRGDRSSYPEMRTYYEYKPVSALSPGKTIGLHAIIALNDNTHKDWVFSFRLIEKNADDFVIESEVAERNTFSGAMIRPGYGGWVKFQNGVPVLTRSDERDLMIQACVFNVKELNTPPVNNEVIDTTTEVIVSGGTGNVLILNAVGKIVIIRNLLGQVLANTVISSNSESVPVPSGVAIVVVENEKGIKTIVK